MSIYEKMKKVKLNLRLARITDDAHMIGMLGLIEADVQRMLKEGKVVTDEAVIQKIKKMISANNEVLEIAKDADKINELNKENSLLNELLPKQLDDDTLSAAIDDIILSKGTVVNIGLVMDALNCVYPGQYDRRTASNLIKARLSGL